MARAPFEGLGRVVSLVIVSLLLLPAAACGGTDEGQMPSEGEPDRSDTSSPFSVGAVPAGYEIETAGMGTAVGDWGSDSFGTVEPYTVLSPDGRADNPDVMLVGITGYEGYEGGLAQASVGYLSDDREELTIDGADAMYAPATDDARGRRWADLVVVRGDDLAVRVSSPDATLDELVAIAEHVEVPDDHTLAPGVPDPPNGLQLVGSADVDGVLATDVYVSPNTDQVPGPRSAHAAGWLRTGSDGEDQLSVLTLPGQALDLAAVGVGTTQPTWIEQSSHSRRSTGVPRWRRSPTGSTSTGRGGARSSSRPSGVTW